MLDNKLLLENGLVVCLDWLSFTIKEDMTEDEVISFLGYNAEEFTNGNGAFGYKRMKKYKDISVLYDGNDNMGIHVNVSGNSISNLIQTYAKNFMYETPFGIAYEIWNETVLMRLLSDILKIGQFTRIDLAIDDHGAKYYSLDEILEKQANQQVSSKWRTYKVMESRDINSNEKVGQTIYYGSSASEIKLRIYDKKLEQNKGKSFDDESYIENEWIRWEIELHKERANEVARKLSFGLPFGKVAIGVLYNYFRIVELDDVNKSRCSDEQKYAEFIGAVDKLRISVKREYKTIDEEREQFEKQNGRKFAKLFFYEVASTGSMEYPIELAERFKVKLTPEDWQQIGMKGFDIDV